MNRFVKDGSVLLDIDCGSGMAAQIAFSKGASVHGIDASEAMLAIGHERVPHGDFRLGEIEELPYPEGRFDLVTGFNAFQYARSPARALSEGRRVSKPDGHIVVMTWGPPDGMPAASLVKVLGPLLPPPPPGAPGPFALSDEAALRALASEAGLTPLDIMDVDSRLHTAILKPPYRLWHHPVWQ